MGKLMKTVVIKFCVIEHDESSPPKDSEDQKTFVTSDNDKANNAFKRMLRQQIDYYYSNKFQDKFRQHGRH